MKLRTMRNRWLLLSMLILIAGMLVAARSPRRGGRPGGNRPNQGQQDQQGGGQNGNNQNGQQNDNDDDEETVELNLFFEPRTLDGTANNPNSIDLGSAGEAFIRIAEASYADDASEMMESPDPRYVSNRIYNDQALNLFSENGVTHWGFVWGQFLDHTIGLRAGGEEQVTFPYDGDDPLESFENDTGVLSLMRSEPDGTSGITSEREQTNTLSSFIDAFAVYGGNTLRLDWLRVGTLDGDPTNNSAELLLTEDGYLPTVLERGNPEDAPHMDLMGVLRMNPTAAIVAGDVRANENIGLTAVHTLFAREHNRIVGELPNNLSEEEKFQIARRVVGATQQWITYQEFLPAFGVDLAPYQGYDATVDPSVSNEFATVGYRAHSMIHGEFELSGDLDSYSSAELDALEEAGIEIVIDGDIVEFAIPLNVAFARPHLLTELGLGEALVGFSSEPQYANDEMIDDQLRSILFQMPAPGAENPAACLDGIDLPDCFSIVNDLGALDLLRQYDHGMPTYNDMREAYGLARYTSFTQITGEDSAEFPTDDPFIDSDDPLNDPNILDFIAYFDADGNELSQEEVDNGAEAVKAVRRTTLAARLAAIYGDIDQLDAFTGMMSEQHIEGTEFGELQLAMWDTQFSALRDGDRFFHLNDPALAEIEARFDINYRQSLAELIVNNTDMTWDDVPANVFVTE